MLKNKILTLIAVLCSIVAYGSQVFAEPESANNKDGGFFWYVVLAGVLAIAAYLVYGWYVNKKVSVKEGEVSQTLSELSQIDPSWSENELINVAEESFYAVEKAIANKDFDDLEKLLHPQLYKKWKEQIENSSVVGKEINRGVENINIVDVKNYKNDEKDMFTASVDIMEAEYTVDKKGNLIFNKEEDTEEIGLLTEYWTFEKENHIWTVVGVNREGKWRSFVNSPIVDEDKDLEN